MILPESHPFVLNFDAHVSEMNGKWRVHWRDFLTVKQDVHFDTLAEAEAFAADLRKNCRNLDDAMIGVADTEEVFPTFDNLWRELYPPKAGLGAFAPKPTSYGGTQFRSRLEATWAAFFDICGIKWVYEPADLKGWCPDFLIHAGKREVWCEVKPVTVSQKIPIDPAFTKAVRHSADLWVMLLGLAPAAEHGSFGRIARQPEFDPGAYAPLVIAADTGVRFASEKWRSAQNLTRWKG